LTISDGTTKILKLTEIKNMPTKSKNKAKLEKLSAEIKRRNELFDGKTNAEKRVLIALDVIAQIKTKRFVPASGVWASTTNPKLTSVGSDGSIRDILIADDTKCSCCALGGIMLSCTLFNNREPVSEWHGKFDDLGDALGDSNTKFYNGLTKIFSKSQLELIETAFELGLGYYLFDYSDVNVHGDGSLKWDAYENPSLTKAERKLYYAVKFGKLHASYANRMIAIMENIVKNGGRFAPHRAFRKDSN
jgi:hypothetical protein